MNIPFISKAAIMALAFALCGHNAVAQTTPTSQMEKLDRGLVALKNGQGSGNFISWRLLGTDNSAVTFNLLRDGEVIKQGIGDVTFYVDEAEGVHQYQVQTVLNGNVIETSKTVTSVDDYYLTLKLDRPNAGSDYTYTPNDCSVGDVDGDGGYELFVKWDPSNSKDNSEKGKTGPTYIDCYKLDGTRLWRINLRHNIRSGAHYVPFMVYDFDGDGKAEMICKTAPGSRDAAGNYVSEVADDTDILATDNAQECWNSNGHIVSGQEFLTVFNGETGNAIHTVWYNPNRAGGIGGSASYTKSVWGDNTMNRGERYLACVAYLDGQDKNPSAVMCRGYYTRAYLWAVDFDGSKLTTRWLHGSVSTTSVELTDASGNKTTKTYSSNTAGTSYSKTLYGNGNHNLSVADVDGDGCDEIIYGSGAVDQDGSLLYSVGYGHGDAMHVSDLLPDRSGLEVFDVHEEEHPAYGWDIHDAATGEVILSETGSSDNGRGMSADVDGDNRGFEFWSSNDRSVRSAVTGDTLSTKSQSQCFRLYWDGDVYDELFDGKYSTSSPYRCNPQITKYNGTSSVKQLTINSTTFANLGNSMSCNTTKATPNLLCDLFGDWREELVLWDASDSCTLNIFTTSIPTEYRVPTLMHDHTYRMGVAWQNAAYNQPPHLGYYLPDYVGNTSSIGATAIANGGWIRLNADHSVSVSTPKKTQVVATVTDLSGCVCWQTAKSVSGTSTISLPRLGKGVRILSVKAGENSLYKKLVSK